MTPRARSGPPGRGRPRQAPRREILAFVEGLRTEELYITHWHREFRERVLVTIDPFRGGPLQLVERAVERRKGDERDARRGRGRPFDEIWCVFDIDEHPNVAQAIALGRNNDIQLAISNPCLELWFILHFEDQTAWIDRKVAQDRSQDLLSCGKVLTPEAFRLLQERHDAASARAQALDEKHRLDASPPGENPSSSVWRLIESIRGG